MNNLLILPSFDFRKVLPQLLLATLVLALFMVPDLAFAQSTATKGIGDTLRTSSDNFKGATTFAKYGFAFVGFCLAGYSLYGFGWGRKKDEREWPVGQTAMAGVFGAALLSISVYMGILNISLFGGDQTDTAAINFIETE